MSSLRRSIRRWCRLGAALFLTQLPPGPAHAARPASLPGAALLRSASLALRTQSPPAVVRRLRHAKSVSYAAVGMDGKTVEFRLKSGVTMAVLPSGGNAAIPIPRLGMARSAAPATGRTAFVLAPFEDEMGMGQHITDLAAKLQDYGFSVTVLTNQAVTVDDMVDLSRYDVVYDVTHSGVNQYGDADIATGQPVDPNNVDPALMPFIRAGSLMVTGVSGTSTEYYGIRAAWIQQELAGQFPPHSLLFLNGCSTLRASLLWQALQGRGLATFVSWDNLAVTGDDAPNADAFFQGLTSGQTVDQSMSALRARGLGISAWAGVPAYLGYVGDGTLRLDGHSSLIATATATATPIPTATTTPIPTPTPEPTASSTTVASVLHVSLHAYVRPRGKQTIGVRTNPDNRIEIRVVYGWGGGRLARRTAGSSGTVRYSFVQPAPPPGTSSRRVRVTVTAGPGGTNPVTLARTYQVSVS